jgi:ethanolamine utilization protein EutP (predicted NTPase)
MIPLLSLLCTVLFSFALFNKGTSHLGFADFSVFGTVFKQISVLTLTDNSTVINHYDVVIDTPGEYAENHTLGRALALYAYEADVVGLLMSATEPYSLYSPNITCMANRDVIGIVTKIDVEGGDPEQAERWLRLAGCEEIFFVNSKNNEGVAEILEPLAMIALLTVVQPNRNQSKHCKTLLLNFKGMTE